MAIHVVTTKPAEVQAAVWDPTDPVQRALVLAWLQDSFGEDGQVEWDFHSDGSIHVIAVSTGYEVLVGPGQAIIFDPETGALFGASEDAFREAFDYSHVLIDPDQYVTQPHPSFIAGIDPASDGATVIIFEVVSI